MTDVIILGGGGWIPTAERATCSALLRSGDRAVLIDAGTGLERLVSDPSLLDGVAELDLVLTHFHLDHVVGLGYLPGTRTIASTPPRVWGPAQVLLGSSSEEALRRLAGPPFYDADFGLIASEVRELDEGEQAIGPFTLTTRVQTRHSTPTLALRFDDLLTYCTDTAYDEGNVAFATASRVLMHEAWYSEDAPDVPEIHSSGREAATIARDAGVAELVLIHLHPRGGHDAVLAEASATFAPTVLGEDLLRREL